MTKKMLVDATHPEETRVVVVQGTRLEDFDFESAARKQLIGNIYLAKVTRIEPSLQAAFVDYGGNRHGFLAFNEIHPDYYQIPVADRQALLEADAAEEQRAEDADEDVDFQIKNDASDRADEDEDEEDAGEGDHDQETVSSQSDSEEDTADDPDSISGGSGSGPMLMAASGPESIRSGLIETPLEDTADTSGSMAASETIETSAGDQRPQDENEGEGGADRLHSDIREAVISGTLEAGLQHAGAESETEQSDPRQNEAGQMPVPDAPSEMSQPARRPARRRRNERSDMPTQARQDGDWDEDTASKRIESVGGEDAMDEVSRPRARRRHYKIQEVIKKRQIMLVQILKDERGSKGAALTTYLSIPGRYCVLMPNTARGGGISRKITNAPDRKRLKAVAAELEVPEGMGLIIRTAGANRTKAEIKRDFDYLLRQWETIRELTLRSTAPCLINEEGSIVKRAVRDLYDKDIEIIQVEGEAGYREAKDFMRMLMPSHAKRVQPYRDPVPLFQRHQVEAQLDSMFDPTVRLKSGGYIVINPTEALVSIDVNSGKSTREANIEATALRTNLEAAEEVARQLRLRDLAGLVVIDFIDMDNLRNNKAVERKVKDCLASDRANIQIGRISPFGLLEMSRQRLRQGVVETTTRPCSNCHGTGLVRSVDSLALRVLRAIEEECLRRQHPVLDVLVPGEVAIYILNQKRQWLHQIEARTASSIFIIASEGVQSPNFEIKASDRIAVIPPPLISAPVPAEIQEEDEAEDVPETLEEAVIEEVTEKPAGERRNRRGREREGEPRKARADVSPDEQRASETSDLQQEPFVKIEGETPEDEAVRRKSRRRRRGRGRNRERQGTQLLKAPDGHSADGETDEQDAGTSGNVLIIPIRMGEAGEEAPRQPEAAQQWEAWRPEVPEEQSTVVLERANDSPPAMVEAYQAEPGGALVAPISSADNVPADGLPPAAADAQKESAPEIGHVEASAPKAEPVVQPLPEAPPGPKRGGWWQRQFGGGF
ncbi:MAG: Rne/Rng family ribonuclease [Alphaproteobacteria bacterium]|nr:Rne/Rng family ribonuclease [Alphaproteobacteria bacterium]